MFKLLDHYIGLYLCRKINIHDFENQRALRHEVRDGKFYVVMKCNCCKQEKEALL